MEVGALPSSGRRPSARIPLLVWAAWSVWPSACMWGSSSPEKLRGHSIGYPPDIYSLASEWFSAGTVIPSASSLVLLPGAPLRGGVLWSSSPLLTNDFEVTLSIKATKPATPRPRDDDPSKQEGIALWYTYENVTAAEYNLTAMHAHSQKELIDGSWTKDFVTEGFDLLGYRSKFEGVGLMFLGHDATPSVAAYANDGKASKFPVKDTAPSDVVQFDWVSGQDVTVTLRVKPDGAVADINGRKVEIKSAFRPGGFLGVTAWGGGKRTQETAEKTTFVELKRLEVFNHNTKVKGEESRDVPVAIPTNESEREDVLHESSTFKEHRQESDAIGELVNMVFKLMVETQPVREQMGKALDSLGKRIDAMESSFAELKSELDRKTGHHLQEEFVALKKELTSLSSVATQETHERHKRLEELHTDIKGAHAAAGATPDISTQLTKMSNSHTKVIDQLANEHQRTFGVSIAAIAFIIIAGLSLYNKFRCWEKKHVL